MRAVSLSNESVSNALKNGFVCGYKNITGESYAGDPLRHSEPASDPDLAASFDTAVEFDFDVHPPRVEPEPPASPS